MAAEVTASTDYRDVFRRYVLRSIEAMSEMLAEPDAVLSDGEREQALHSLGYALDLPEAWLLASNLLVTLAPRLEQAGYRGEWMAYLERGVERSLAQGDALAESELRFYLGVLYQLQSRYEDASRCFLASAARAEALSMPLKQGRALNRLANVALRQSRLQEAARLAESTRNLVASDSAEEGYCHFILGSVAYDRHDMREATRFYRQSLALWEQTGDERLVAWGLTNLGTALRGLERYQDARDCYQRAIELFDRLEDPVHQAVARMNLGNVYLMRDELSEALDCYRQAEPVFRRVQDLWRLATVYGNMALVHRRLQQLDQAKAAVLTSIDLWGEIGHVESLVNVMDGLALIQEAQGDADGAMSTLLQARNRLATLPEGPRVSYLAHKLAQHVQRLQANADPPARLHDQPQRSS